MPVPNSFGHIARSIIPCSSGRPLHMSYTGYDAIACCMLCSTGNAGAAHCMANNYRQHMLTYYRTIFRWVTHSETKGNHEISLMIASLSE